MMSTKKHAFYLITLLLIMLTACTAKDPEPVISPATGKLVFEFLYYCEGAPLVFDVRDYVNEAGNAYMVNEIQYFISDVTLLSYSPGADYLIDAWKDIHYIDTDIPSTQEWNVFDDIPEGDYSGIRFTFGINEEKNQSLMFTDPPESLMFWPQYLGGGYHYMKLNGKWLDTNQFERPFDFHLGIGQVYDQQTGDVTGFIQNYFTIDIPASGFTIINGQELVIPVVMYVDHWFKNPNTFDFNYWGGDIMQTQDAMKVGCENGQDVFEVLGVGF